eukprot:1142608-Pelagomonas_calceolata.AAC.4
MLKRDGSGVTSRPQSSHQAVPAHTGEAHACGQPVSLPASAPHPASWPSSCKGQRVLIPKNRRITVGYGEAVGHEVENEGEFPGVAGGAGAAAAAAAPPPSASLHALPGL